MSYLSTGFGAQQVEQKVQTLFCTLGDSLIVSVSGSTATIDVGQTISAVRAASFFDDSAATSASVVASNRVVAGSQVTLTLSAALASADMIALYFVV